MEEYRGIDFLARNFPGNHEGYRGIPMDGEEVEKRRQYIREKINKSSFSDKNDDEIDRCRYYETSEAEFFEDEDSYCYILSIDRSGESEFRKVHAMMPPEYIGLRTRDFDWKLYGKDVEASKKMLNYYLLGFGKMLESGMGLYIHSETKGSGKTMLSCCILNEIANRYPAVSVKFVNALELLEITKESYDGAKDDLNQVYGSSVLVIDDIGVQMSKQWVNTVFYRLINKRHDERRVTIYTSNVSVGSLSMDERIVQRIEARSYAVTLPEVSIRRIKADKEKERILEEIKSPP